MTNREYNVKALNDTYKNAHIALQSIKDVLPSVKNNELKRELNEEYEGYNSIINQISAFAKENGIMPKDINWFKKASMFCAIKMKLVFNNSKNHIADMMIQGTNMGIIELTAMKNESKNLDEDVKNLIVKLLALEEEYLVRLKKFL